MIGVTGHRAVAGVMVMRSRNDVVEYPGIGKRRVYKDDIEYHYQIPWSADSETREWIRQSLQDARSSEVGNALVVLHIETPNGMVPKIIQEPRRVL